MSDKNSLLLTIPEAAARLKMRESTIRAWILQRRLGYVKVGRRAVRISEREVLRVIEQGTVPAQRADR